MIDYHRVCAVDKQMNKLVSDRVGICCIVKDTGEKEGAIGAFINGPPATLSKKSKYSNSVVTHIHQSESTQYMQKSFSHSI